MSPIGMFTIKSLIVAAIVVASMSIFGPQMTRVIAAAWFEGETAFLMATYEKLVPNDERPEEVVLPLMLKPR